MTYPEQFAKNSDADFSRKCKLDFENLMRLLISMESGTTEHEIKKLYYLRWSIETSFIDLKHTIGTANFH